MPQQSVVMFFTTMLVPGQAAWPAPHKLSPETHLPRGPHWNLFVGQVQASKDAAHSLVGEARHRSEGSAQQVVMGVRTHPPATQESRVHSSLSLHCDAAVQVWHVVEMLLTHAPLKQMSSVQVTVSLQADESLQEMQPAMVSFTQDPESQYSSLQALRSGHVIAEYEQVPVPTLQVPGLQGFPRAQAALLCVWTTTGVPLRSQVSIVQMLLSSSLSSRYSQPPERFTNPDPHASSRELQSIGWNSHNPVEGLQLSCVVTLLSLQTTGTGALHSPPMHFSEKQLSGVQSVSTVQVWQEESIE